MTFLRTNCLTCNPDVVAFSSIPANCIQEIIFYVQLGSNDFSPWIRIESCLAMCRERGWSSTRSVCEVRNAPRKPRASGLRASWSWWPAYNSLRPQTEMYVKFSNFLLLCSALLPFQGSLNLILKLVLKGLCKIGLSLSLLLDWLWLVFCILLQQLISAFSSCKIANKF